MSSSAAAATPAAAPPPPPSLSPAAFAACVPDLLDPALHKGSCGRVGVLGGSPDYTGAPYYAAISALKFGADLSYVFCAAEAGPAIKSYSPELMVTPVYSRAGGTDGLAHTVAQAMSRLHVLVIGPGLGRSAPVLAEGEGVLAAAQDAGLPLVIDADGLWLLSSKPELIAAKPGLAVLTPNLREYVRLRHAVMGPPAAGAAGRSSAWFL